MTDMDSDSVNNINGETVSRGAIVTLCIVNTRRIRSRTGDRGASPRPPSSRGPRIRETRTDYQRILAVFDGFSSNWRTKLLPFLVFSSASN